MISWGLKVWLKMLWSRSGQKSGVTIVGDDDRDSQALGREIAKIGMENLAQLIHESGPGESLANPRLTAGPSLSGAWIVQRARRRTGPWLPESM